MNTTVPDPAPKSRSYLVFTVVAVIAMLIAGDIYYHFSSIWNPTKDIGAGLAAEVRNLQYEAGKREEEIASQSNKIAKLHALTNQTAAAQVATAQHESAIRALRVELEKCRKEFADANAALETKNRQVENVGTLAQTKDSEIARLKQRIESLEREMRERMAATNAVPGAAIPDITPVKPPGDSGTAVPSVPPVAHTGGAPEPRKKWLDSPGVPGMCRGMLRVACAPLVVPYGVASGVASPWEGAPGTNTVTGTLGSAASTPLSIAVGSVAGAGGCVADTLSGTADICTMGYYGVRDNKFTGQTDGRPAVAQLLDREEPARVIAVEDDQTKPRAGVRGQQTVSFPVH